MSQSTEIRQAIEEANKIFLSIFGQGDAAGLAALYASEGQILPPNGDFVVGHAAIQGFWQAVFNSGLTGAALDTLEVEQFGDTAIEVGKYQLLVAGGQVADWGKYIVIWKHEGGAWKLHRDIFNSSRPPA